MSDKFSDNTIKAIASFGDRYLGSILSNLYLNHPDFSDEIKTMIDEAVAMKNNDSVNKLLEEACLPGYPDHQTLKDFDASCLSDSDKTIYENVKSGNSLLSNKPNLILYGPPDQGKEKIAIGLADLLCRARYNVRFIDFHLLMETLQTHGRISSSNTLYQSLSKVECLIIDDFAGMNIHDVDLLDSLYVLLRNRKDNHLSISSRRKPRATFITTYHHPQNWPKHLIGDDFKVLHIINILYGSGSMITVDEKAEKKSSSQESAQQSSNPNQASTQTPNPEN